jgi:hypothetical protein
VIAKPPSAVVDNVADALICDAVHGGNCFLVNSRPQPSYFINLYLSEIVMSAVLPILVFIRAFYSSLLFGISHVLKLSPKPEMIGIYTSGIVPSGAVVKDLKTVIRAFMNKPRSPMNEDHFSRPESSINSTITRPVGVSSPYPTRFGLVHLCPKTAYKCMGESLIDHPLRGSVRHRLVDLPDTDSRSCRAFSF